MFNLGVCAAVGLVFVACGDLVAQEPATAPSARGPQSEAQATMSADALAVRAEARSWLVSTQDVNGSWELDTEIERHRSGIEGLAILALAGDPKEAGRTAALRAMRSSIARRLEAAESTGERPATEYSDVVWTLAVIEMIARDESFREMAQSSLARCLAARGFEADETCYIALLLLAAARARERGVEIDESVVAGLLSKLERRAPSAAGAFDAHDFPSASYGATGLACEALLAWNRSNAPATKHGLAWLERQSLTESLRDLAAPRFAGYLRGRHIFELRAHVATLRATRSPALSRYRQAIVAKAKLLSQNGPKSVIDTCYGRVYGTALLVLTLDSK